MKKVFILYFLYNLGINRIIRNINYFVLPILPKKIQINPLGVVTIKTF